MSGNQLIIPSPKMLLAPGAAQQIRAWANQETSSELLGDYRAKLLAVAKYLKDKQQRQEAAAAARYIEIRIGELLGPAEQTYPGKNASLVGEPLPKDDRHKFRILAENKEKVEALLAQGVTSRSNLLKAIKTKTVVPGLETCTVSDLEGLITQGRKFGTIYADPPWKYDNQGTRAATDNHYSGMTIEELAALPVGNLAADDAHLHLWTTNGFLFECPKLFEAWGFEFRSSFIWVKPQMGIGNYWRNSHEILLTAIRGNAKRFNDKSLKSWASINRTAHSEKPEIIRSFIERASDGPYLELFGRRRVDRWVVWGNQIERSMFDQAVGE